METKKTMEALGEWDEQVYRVSANGVNLTEEKSTDSWEESQTAFHLWGGEQLRHPGQDELWCVLLAGWHRWDWKSLILVFRWHHRLQSRMFSSGTGEMDLKPRKTDPLFKDSGMSSLDGRRGREMDNQVWTRTRVLPLSSSMLHQPLDKSGHFLLTRL